MPQHGQLPGVSAEPANKQSNSFVSIFNDQQAPQLTVQNGERRRQQLDMEERTFYPKVCE